MNRCFLVLVLLATAHSLEAADYRANPRNYTSLLATLKAGDHLMLSAGIYDDGLAISNLNGTAKAGITIRGPAEGLPAIFTGAMNRSRNTVEIVNSSYVTLKNLRIDGRNIPGVFGISAKDGSNNRTHHITIENCTLVGHGGSQQTVGISTKTPTWGWVIRKNSIMGAGTGLYLGNSDGTQPFIGGVIEGNLIDDPEGYGMQIKHQLSRPPVPGMPTTPQTTVIRDNVFIKTDRPSRDGDRPHLLIGGLPDSGPGSQDLYQIYGNVFYHNPRESLLQAEGRVTIHDNLFIDASRYAINLRNHNMTLRLANVYHNTIYKGTTGIHFGSPATESHYVAGNLIFADVGIGGQVTHLDGNRVDTVANAVHYVNSPSTVLGSMDFYPSSPSVTGPAIDFSSLTGELDCNRDFNKTLKSNYTFRGAYFGRGSNPGWRIQRARKPIR